jgi:hypothetical protein
LKTTTHEEIVEHLRDVRRMLSQHGWSLERMAETAGVKKHTLSQYCQMPETKGARLIPAATLDRLRTAAVRSHHDHWDRAWTPFMTREQRLWFVVATAEFRTLLESTDVRFAESYAARHRAMCTPGPENARPDYRLHSDEQRCVDWLGFRHGGFVTKEDAMAVAGVDEYLVERVGLELMCWRILPTREQVDALGEIHHRRFADAA